jgi:hypothetical protein
MELKDEIFDTVNTKLLESYDNLQKWDVGTGPAKFGANRFPYVKDYRVNKAHSNQNVKCIAIHKIVPIFWGYNNEELKGLFSVYKDLHTIFLKFGLDPSVSKVAGATQDLMIACLESNEMSLPKPKEMTQNLRDNIDGFISYVIAKNIQIRSVAPLIGCSFDDSILLDKVSFRRTSCDDMSLMFTVSHNFYGNDITNPNISSIIRNRRSPVLVLDHEFKMIIDQNDWSVEQNMERLHSTFKETCRDIIASIRLRSAKRIGIHRVYHRDSIWTRHDSFQHITEDPSPIYKPLSSGRYLHSGDEFLLPPQTVYKRDIIDTFSKIQLLYPKKSFYLFLIEGFDHYSKSMEEHEIRWQLLDLVVALESLATVSNGMKGNFDKKGKLKPCDTADKIIHALDVRSDSDKQIIEKAYMLRSRASVAHSNLSSESISPKLISDLRNVERRIILCLLEAI